MTVRLMAQKMRMMDGEDNCSVASEAAEEKEEEDTVSEEEDSVAEMEAELETN